MTLLVIYIKIALNRVGEKSDFDPLDKFFNQIRRFARGLTFFDQKYYIGAHQINGW
jgi:hypothetical protein